MVRTSARVAPSCATPAYHPDPEESLHLSELQAALPSVDACGSAPVWLQRVTVSPALLLGSPTAWCPTPRPAPQKSPC